MFIGKLSQRGNLFWCDNQPKLAPREAIPIENQTNRLSGCQLRPCCRYSAGTARRRMALTKALRLAASGDTVSVSKVALSAVSSHTIVRPKYPSGAFRSNQFCAPKNSSKNGNAITPVHDHSELGGETLSSNDAMHCPSSLAESMEM